MQKIIIPFFILIPFSLLAQVGIGTTTPSPSSILELQSTTQTFVPPRMSDTQMYNITNPLVGAIVYNTTEDALYKHTTTGWVNISKTSNPVISMSKNFTGADTAVSTTNNVYSPFPLHTGDVQFNTVSTFSLTGSPGQIKINEAGTYLINAAFSVENVPSGSRKFIIGIYKNGTLIGYPTRGTVTLDTTDSWGCSGTITEAFSPNDVIAVRYVLNNDSTHLDALNFTIGIVKLR